MTNLDERTVQDFGKEWSRFDQSALSSAELMELFSQYFDIFPWDAISPSATGMDVGCGSGRWALQVAPRVGRLHCIDASALALDVARRNLSDQENCEFHLASVGAIPLKEASLDFGYCLGVLHHVPDPAAGLRACGEKLKPGAPFLVYLYYAFDNRPFWFKGLWRVSEFARAIISRMPTSMKVIITSAIAVLLYLPLAKIARLFERLGMDVQAFPLSYYRHRSIYTMRTDALDRFGTRLEKRFRREEVKALLEGAGFTQVEFSPHPPYWCAVGFRAP